MNNPEATFGVADPVVLVTGAGAPRVGRCVADTLWRRGYRVVLHARDSFNEARETAQQWNDQRPDSACAVQGDVGDEEDVERFVGEAAARFGRLDGLVQCAAAWGAVALEEIVADDATAQWRANALGVLMCGRAAGLRMVDQQHGGAIVNVGDWATIRPYLNYAHYYPSKGAVEAITRSLAVELAHRQPKIRVNAILAGPVMLPADVSEHRRRHAIESTLVKREGRPDDVAQAAAFLLEQQFITGVCLPVDGGLSIFGGDARSWHDVEG